MHTENDFRSLQQGYLKNLGDYSAKQGCSSHLTKDKSGQNQFQITCYLQWQMTVRLNALRIISSYWLYAPALTQAGTCFISVLGKEESRKPGSRTSYILKNGVFIKIDEEL